MENYKYLIKVEPGANNNKYYEMIVNEGSVFTVNFGRVGCLNPQHVTYPISKYDSKLREKLNKGYVDRTELVAVEATPTPNDGYVPIPDKEIAKIVEHLRALAKATVEKNYLIGSASVTQKMIDEAQKYIDELLQLNHVLGFNIKLTELFTIIPRKMGAVKDYLANDSSDFNNIICKEQDLLDVMKGQVTTNQIQESGKPVTNQTILEALGLEMMPCSNNDIQTIKHEMGDISNRFANAWRIVNKRTEERYNKYLREKGITNTKLLFHGTRSENVWSIYQTSLCLRPTNAVITGKMLGYGLYFAPKARKSLGYTSLDGSYWVNGRSNEGYMFLFDVAYGKAHHADTFSGYGNMTEEKLKQLDSSANCIHAHAGNYLRNDEIIVYNEAAVNMKYLIQLR